MGTLTPVTFRFPSVLVPTAQHISLLGRFNKWTRGVHPLASTGNGWWNVTVCLPPGRVAYCFDVDGTAWLDPNDHGRAPNGWGSEHSVRNVEPISEPATSHRPAKVHAPIQGGAQVFECSVQETAGAIILRPSGEVDLATVAAFRDALTAAAVRGCSVVVDMSGIRYFDTTGVHALFDHAHACKQRDYVLMLAAPQSTVQKVIEITHLDDAIPVLASVEAALDLLRARLVHRWPSNEHRHESRTSALTGGKSMDTPSSQYGRPSPILNIETEDHGGTYVVRLSGEVDLATITLLQGALDGQVHDSRKVVLECQHLTYIDSTGLNLLADLYRQGRRFVLVAPMPALQKILEITRLDTLLPVAASVDEALNVLAEEC